MPIAKARIVDVGAGTGRILRVLARAGAGFVVGFDRSPAMLAVAQRHLRDERLAAAVGVADATAVPVGDGCADGAVAGWVFGHFRTWMPDGWRAKVAACLGEMR